MSLKYVVGCDECQFGSGVLTDEQMVEWLAGGPRLEAALAGWASRKGIGAGSAIYPRTDRCVAHGVTS
ncbi:MAG: hypothetical protein ACOH10_07870 [Rhodoglobus sp.]